MNMLHRYHDPKGMPIHKRECISCCFPPVYVSMLSQHVPLYRSTQSTSSPFTIFHPDFALQSIQTSSTSGSSTGKDHRSDLHRRCWSSSFLHEGTHRHELDVKSWAMLFAHVAGFAAINCFGDLQQVRWGFVACERGDQIGAKRFEHV